MSSYSDWLPELVLLADAGGDWPTYEAVLYRWFRSDFVESKPGWPGKRVALKRMPMEKGKEATFWHFITEGPDELSRTVDIRRCERIRWPRPVMDRFDNREHAHPTTIVWWKTWRRSEERYVLSLPDFSYVVVVADRGAFVLPWTAFCVEREHRRRKLQREFDKYWRSQKS